MGCKGALYTESGVTTWVKKCTCFYVKHDNSNAPIPIVTDRFRCSIRFTTLGKAEKACNENPDCESVVKDNGMCKPTKLYELRKGALYTDSGITTWVKKCTCFYVKHDNSNAPI